MELTQIGENLLLSKVKNFDPFVSCECGQCFRFERLGEEEVELSARGRVLRILKHTDGWLFCDIDEAEFRSDFFDYFDLGRDYGAIIDSFSFDEKVSAASKSGNGIRIFRQEPFETLISFIISQNNNIPRIKKIINSLCILHGEEKNGFHTFPTAEKICSVGLDGLAPIKSGFRAKYILDASEKVVSGEVSFERIAKADFTDALEELKKIKGVGDKVGNCVLLFGFGFLEAFPVDVWVKRVITKYYGDGFDPSRFGKYAGVAQQYLFNFERNQEGKDG